MGTTLWQTQGPWAGRAFAAHQYWNWYGASSTHWYWGARSLDIPAPYPLLFSHVRETTSEAAPQMNATSDPKPALRDRPPRRPRDASHAPAITNPEPLAADPSPPQQVPSESRDLKGFEVADNAPSRKRVTPWKGSGAPARLEPRAWDGRNLAALPQYFFSRAVQFSARARHKREKWEFC